MVTVMSKQKKPEKGTPGEKGQRNRLTAPIQVKTDLARMAAVIASHDRITQADLIDTVLRPFLKMHYERVHREMSAQIDQSEQE